MKKTIILILIAGVAAVFAGLAIHDHLREETAGQVYEEVREEFKIESTPTPTPTIEVIKATATPTPVSRE